MTKTEKANFARVKYKKILWFYLWSGPFNEKDVVDRLKMVEDFITDHCTEIPAKIAVKCNKGFTAA